LVEIGGLIPMGNTKPFYDKLIEFIENDDERKNIGEMNKEFVYSHCGSSQIVYDNLIKPL
jgi:hypothetical protein